MKHITATEVKKRLYNYTRLDVYINDYTEELQAIQERIQAHRDVGISSVSLANVKGSDISDPTTAKAIKIDELQQVYENRIKYIAGKIKEYYQEKQEIEEALELLHPEERQVIECRYFLRKTWEETRDAIDGNMSLRYYEGIGNSALKAINQYLQKK